MPNVWFQNFSLLNFKGKKNFLSQTCFHYTPASLDTLRHYKFTKKMNIKKILILVVSLIVLVSVYYFIANKRAVADFFGYYQLSPDSVCGNEGETIGGNIEGCCSGLKSKPAEPFIKNGPPGGLFVCSK